MNVEPVRRPVRVTKHYEVAPSDQPGVVISVRDYDRLIERLEGCKRGGWADLWLAGVGAGVALATAALVGGLTLPVTLTGTRDVLWAVTAAGSVVFCLCLVGYLTQRRDHAREISELRKDLELQKTQDH